MVSIDRYQVFMNGGAFGYNNFRVAIHLYNNNVVVGMIWFRDPSMALEQDYVDQNNVIVMHQPLGLLPSLLNLLQQHKIELNIDQTTSWLNTI